MSEQDNSISSNAQNAHNAPIPLTEKQRAVKQQKFLKALGEHGVVKYACKYAGINRSTYKYWKDHYPDFAALLPDTFSDRNDTLEYAAYNQAVDGVPSYVVNQGRIVYHEVPIMNEDGTPKLDKNGNEVMKRGKPIIERKYAPNLLITLLKANMPEKYKDKASFEHTGKDGGPLQHSIEIYKIRIPDNGRDGLLEGDKSSGKDAS